MVWALDLDGVVWRGVEVISGSSAAIRAIQDGGSRVLYVTNNATLTTDDYVAKLGRFGIEATGEDIVHGGHAVALLTKPGWKVLVCAGVGVAEALERHDVDPVMAEDLTDLTPPAVDAVVVGWGAMDTGYRRLTMATRAVLAGAQLLAPSPDPLYPSGGGVFIGGGALAAAVGYATGTTPLYAGKPAQSMVDAVRARSTEVGIVVGDQPATDGALAARMEVPFALVHSGVSKDVARPPGIPIALEGADLAEVVERWRSTMAS